LVKSSNKIKYIVCKKMLYFPISAHTSTPTKPVTSPEQLKVWEKEDLRNKKNLFTDWSTQSYMFHLLCAIKRTFSYLLFFMLCLWHLIFLSILRQVNSLITGNLLWFKFIKMKLIGKNIFCIFLKFIIFFKWKKLNK
jgi:hypothetical protein